MSDLAAFVAVAARVIVTPGPDTALTIRNTLLGGRRGGVCTAAGVAGGQAVRTVATVVGLAALLGAAYLVLLGAQAIRTALVHRGGRRMPAVEGLTPSQFAPYLALRQGVISNLTNPKMAAFFPALLPQFAPEGDAALFGLLALGL